MANNIYKEKQRFHDWFVLGFLILVILGLLVGAASYFWSAETTLSYSLACLGLAAGLGYVYYSLRTLRSKLTITDSKIKFKLKGVLQASTKIAWDDIESCTIVKSRQLTKFNRPKVTLSDEKFLSLDGRNGLMIVTKNGERYFIGCQNVEDLQEALNSEGEIWDVDIST